MLPTATFNDAKSGHVSAVHPLYRSHCLRYSTFPLLRFVLYNFAVTPKMSYAHGCNSEFKALYLLRLSALSFQVKNMLMFLFFTAGDYTYGKLPDSS